MTETYHREPYVGEGEDGARRSARIDRDKADGLSWIDERKDDLIASAAQWEDQAYRLMLHRLGERPSINEVRASAGSEEWLAAIALLEQSPALWGDAARYTEWSRDSGRFTYEGDGEDRVSTFHPNPLIAWDRWVISVEEQGRGWSSTELSLYQVIAGLVTDRPLKLRGVLDAMGSWEHEVLDVLVQWATGGNNRDRPGRLVVTNPHNP